MEGSHAGRYIGREADGQEGRQVGKRVGSGRKEGRGGTREKGCEEAREGSAEEGRGGGGRGGEGRRNRFILYYTILYYNVSIHVICALYSWIHRDPGKGGDTSFPPRQNGRYCPPLEGLGLLPPSNTIAVCQTALARDAPALWGASSFFARRPV